MARHPGTRRSDQRLDVRRAPSAVAVKAGDSSLGRLLAFAWAVVALGLAPSADLATAAEPATPNKGRARETVPVADVSSRGADASSRATGRAPGDDRRLKASDFRLVGGWRLAQEYPRGGLAIDFDGRRGFVGGHAQRQEIVEFSLASGDGAAKAGEMISPGTGDDVMKWPRLDPVRVHPGFWEEGYVGGLFYQDDTLWVSPKKFYDMSPPPRFRLYGKNLRTGKVETREVELPRQAFGGGFVKGKPGTILLGCGGYESGQGSVAGPTLATLDGKVLIGQANHGTLDFARRELRPATYWPANHVDGWIALEPREGVGRWACDRVHAGGIWRPRGVAYWALLGIGDIDYARQNETFAATTETWLYTYDPQRYDRVEFTKWEHGHVHGHEVGPDGRVYLLIRNAWASGVARTDSVIKVFEIAE